MQVPLERECSNRDATSVSSDLMVKEPYGLRRRREISHRKNRWKHLRDGQDRWRWEALVAGRTTSSTAVAGTLVFCGKGHRHHGIMG